MPKEFSFDVVCKHNAVEVRNSVQHAQKELSTRFDFKGSKASIELDDESVVLIADDEFKLDQLRDIFENKCIKRGLDPKAISYTDPKAAGHMTVRQVVDFQNGISADNIKKITKLIKEKKLKAQPVIQGDQIRVSSKSKDSLQECMQIIKDADFDFAISFENYR